jgi:hypothetical protein
MSETTFNDFFQRAIQAQQAINDQGCGPPEMVSKEELIRALARTCHLAGFLAALASAPDPGLLDVHAICAEAKRVLQETEGI